MLRYFRVIFGINFPKHYWTFHVKPGHYLRMNDAITKDLSWDDDGNWPKQWYQFIRLFKYVGCFEIYDFLTRYELALLRIKVQGSKKSLLKILVHNLITSFVSFFATSWIIYIISINVFVKRFYFVVRLLLYRWLFNFVHVLLIIQVLQAIS